MFKGAMYKYVLFLICIIFVACEKKKDEVSMVCTWVLYETQRESFVFDLAGGEVYWVEENVRLPIGEVNEGRIVFRGIKSELNVGVPKSKFGGIPLDNQNTIEKDVPLEFIIDRVTGRLVVKGVVLPNGYNNVCKVQAKVI